MCSSVSEHWVPKSSLLHTPLPLPGHPSSNKKLLITACDSWLPLFLSGVMSFVHSHPLLPKQMYTIGRSTRGRISEVKIAGLTAEINTQKLSAVFSKLHALWGPPGMGFIFQVSLGPHNISWLSSEPCLTHPDQSDRIPNKTCRQGGGSLSGVLYPIHTHHSSLPLLIREWLTDKRQQQLVTRFWQRQ